MLPTSLGRGMGKLAFHLTVATVAASFVAPIAASHTLVRGQRDTYLDFTTHMVYTADGESVGLGDPYLYAAAHAWKRGEPMTTTAYYIEADVNRNPPIEGEHSEMGVCLATYCVSAEMYTYTPAEMYVTWFECPLGVGPCSYHASGTFVGNLRVTWIMGYNPEPGTGLVMGLCLFVNGVPIEGQCGQSMAYAEGGQTLRRLPGGVGF